MHYAYLLLTLYFSIDFYCCKLSCKNENNEEVDWFIALKYPKSYDFVYLSNSQQKWTESFYNLSNAKNLVALTIEQTYFAKKTSSFYGFYNDESPYQLRNTGYRGHLKGVINFDGSNGFWLVHSVPRFPFSDTYEYEKGQSRYGQSFFCVSLTSEYLKPIISQLLIMQSTVYSSYLPTNFTKDEDLDMLINRFINNKNVKNNPFYQAIKISTLNHLELIHFGKSKNFNNDLYADLVAPQLKSSIFVESWIRGDKIPSSCQINYRVYNVEEVKLPNKMYSDGNDHSKWVVSKNETNPFICIGDINRMTSQFKRGGGTLCIKDLGIWKIFSAIIMSYEQCD